MSVIVVEVKRSVFLRTDQNIQMPHRVFRNLFDVAGRHENAASTQKHRNAVLINRNHNRLPAFVLLHVVGHVVPESSCGKINFSCLRAFFHDIRNKNRRTEHEFHVAVAVKGFVLRELIEERTHDRRAVHTGLAHQRIQIRQHLIAQVERAADIRQVFLIHPGLRHGIVRVRGIDNKAGLENRGLDPAEQHLLGRRRTCKTADVAAHVRAAGKSHTENRINIELDRAPVRQIVAAPDLRIALDAGKSRAVDDIRPLALPFFKECFSAEPRHHVGMDDLELGHRAALPFKIAVSAPVLHTVHLAVVIPDRLFAHGEDCFIEEFFPRVTACFARKVDEPAFAAPPAAVIIVLAVRRFDERVSLLVEVRVRMILQHTGLQITDHVDAARRHCVKEFLRVRETFVIPVEGIAQIVFFS